MTSVAAWPQTAHGTPPAAPTLAAAKVARAADGDYKTRGVGHEVKDADGDYRPTNATGSASSTTASSTLSALTTMKRGG